MSDLHAAIDIGTNSIHLVVARATTGGGFDVVTTEKEMVRLGSGGGDMKHLAPDAIERGVSALARMAEVARSLGADITAVATSAVREAENRDELVDRVRREHGIEIEVISGVEEARLIHHGVIHAVPVSDQRSLTVDIGGGSTELIVGEGPELVEARSLRLGAIRVTQRFFPAAATSTQPPNPEAVADCRLFLRGALANPGRELGGHQPEIAIGSSGTITAVATMIAATRGGAGARQMNGFRFTAAELADTVDTVVTSTPIQRRKLRGLDDRRADIVVGGILLLDEIFNAFGLEAMTLSEFALREGVLFDRFPAGDNHLRDLRRSNALRLARQLDPDMDHAEATARLAGQLFDRTKALHGLDPLARQLLDVAALVHNVGLFVAHSAHHKHSYYIVRNSEQLTGFTEAELELVALIARYHRKSLPSDKHHEFAQLSERDQRWVRILAGMLRIAIGLDRRHTGVVTAISVRVESEEVGGEAPAAGKSPSKAAKKATKKSAEKSAEKAAAKAAKKAAKKGTKEGARRLVIEPVVADGADIGVEIDAAQERVSLLSDALGLPIVVRPRTPTG